VPLPVDAQVGMIGLVSSDAMVFVGGANVPTADAWRVNATYPFAN
jgi:hypothetical protein